MATFLSSVRATYLPGTSNVRHTYLGATYTAPRMASQPPLPEPDPWQVDLSERVSKLQKVKLTDAPTPVVARAEQLCNLVDDVDGIRPDRADLIAALVHAAQPDGKKLAEIWQRYRTAPVHQVILEAEAERGPLDLSPFKKR
jgi:hypothetical protein